MASKHICPQCGGLEFDTVAHVMQSWKVDQDGDFISVIDECLQTTARPDDGNIWTCINCGSEADVV